MRYFKKIGGELVYLSPMNTDDIEIYTKWMNDPEVAGYLGQYQKVISLDGEKKALENLANNGYNFAIVRADDNMLLGNISLMDVNLVSRKATAGVFIGEAENRGKGYGTEAMRLLLDYGFNALGLNNIMLLVHSDNPRAIASYKKAGFREFGRRREADYKSGRYVDDIYMEILAREFNDKKGSE